MYVIFISAGGAHSAPSAGWRTATPSSVTSVTRYLVMLITTVHHFAAEGTSPWQRLRNFLGEVTGPVRAARGRIRFLTAAFCLDRRSVMEDLSEAKGMASSSSSQHSSLKNQVGVLSIYNQKEMWPAAL